MAHHKSAQKRIRRNARRSDVNSARVGRIRTYLRYCEEAIASGDRDKALAALEHLQGVPGRLEKVAVHASGAPVYVDYAHTPDALAHALTALAPQAANRLVVVFGCGGDRDRAKRPQMGSIACRLADRIIVTDDNPRGEDPGAIRRAVLEGCDRAVEAHDRGVAIRAAVRDLDQGDVLVIAGKGHERGQLIGHDMRPFDDAQEARQAVSACREVLS